MHVIFGFLLYCLVYVWTFVTQSFTVFCIWWVMTREWKSFVSRQWSQPWEKAVVKTRFDDINGFIVILPYLLKFLVLANTCCECVWTYCCIVFWALVGFVICFFIPCNVQCVFSETLDDREKWTVSVVCCLTNLI